jgi:2-hydroxy-3-keto-5-methylthiopentenyl-1-phosphate phosphatase
VPERLVVDWDGTVTEVDGLHLVLLEFGDVGVYEDAEERLGRTLTLHEVIAVEFETVQTPLDEVVAWVRENVRVRAGFAELARRRRPLVVSSGFRELIDPVLEREGIELDVVANQLDPRPDGWRARFRPAEVCPVCGERCKRSDVGELEDVVYVGDGFSDRCIALGAGRVLARDGLAEYLEREGVPFEPFADFYDVDRRLDEGGAAVPATRSRGRGRNT